MDFPLRGWIEKTVLQVEIHILSCKEKDLGAVVSKESHADSLLVYELQLQLISSKKGQL